MKKHRLARMLLCVLLCLPPAAAAQGLRIAASCVPAALAAISAGAQEVSMFIMPQMGYMEDYALSQADYMRAQEADVVLLLGGGLESFGAYFYAEGTKPTIVAGEDIVRLPGRVINPDEDTQASDNPYVWLSPTRWAQLVHGTASALAQIDAENAPQYTQASMAAQESAARVQEALTALGKQYASRQVIVLHPALVYLCEDAGLEVVMSIERDPSVFPYAADMAEIENAIAAYPDAIVVVEKDAPAAFMTIGGRKTARCEVLLRAQGQMNALTWEGIMTENVEALLQALQ